MVKVRVLPVSLEFLAGVLGVLGIFFAYLAGRSGAQVRKGTQKLTRFYGWLIRAAACLIVIALRHPLDAMDLIVWSLAAAFFALAWWDAARAKPEEDLSKEMFREQ
jgi:hypothetical protein